MTLRDEYRKLPIKVDCHFEMQCPLGISNSEI